MSRLAVVLVAVSILACSERAEEDVRSCVGTQDCKKAEKCTGGTCVKAPTVRCELDTECSAGGACIDHICRGGTACDAPSDCGAGERCDSPGICVIAECTLLGACPNGGGCDFAKGRCGPARACDADAECTPPKGRCDGGFCAAGCGSVPCETGNTCVKLTGRCQPRVTCSDDEECGAPARVCLAGRCGDGCATSGCDAGENCSATTGRCELFSGTCTSDSACGAPSRICEGQACVPGCGTSGCQPYEVCSGTTGRCEAKVCSSPGECSAPAGRCATGICIAGCGTNPCSSGTCEASGECSVPQTGGTCTTNNECASKYCHTIATLPSEIGVCSQTCSSSATCPPDTRCAEIPAAKGVKACLGASAGLVVGTVGKGGICNRAADCRSGLCAGASLPGKCFDGCSRDQDCSVGEHCRAIIDNAAAHTFVQVCLSDADNDATTQTYPAECSLSCASFFCTDDAEYCLSGCCKSADCGTGSHCMSMLPIFTGDASQSTTLMHACTPLLPNSGNDPVGAPCSLSDGKNCRSNFCVGNKYDGAVTAAYCSDTCCTDADCGLGFACVAAADPSGYSFTFCGKL